VLIHREDLAADAVGAGQPVVDQGANLRPCGRLEAGTEGLDVGVPEFPGPVASIEMGGREETPRGLDDTPVDLADLADGEALFTGLPLYGLPVDPVLSSSWSKTLTS
jgi:hypothetical protein